MAPPTSIRIPTLTEAAAFIAGVSDDGVARILVSNSVRQSTESEDQFVIFRYPDGRWIIVINHDRLALAEDLWPEATVCGEV